MTDLTLLVRLNERVPVGPVTLPSAGGPVSGNPVIVMVSAVGEGTIMPGSFSDSASFYLNKVIKPAKATKAAGTIKRIMDPNNDNSDGAGHFFDNDKSHIDVADTSKSYQQQGSGSDYQLTKVYYPNVPADEANTAIIGTWADNGDGSPGIDLVSGFSEDAGSESAGVQDFSGGKDDQGDAPDGMGGNDSGDGGGGDGGGGGGGP